MHAKLSTISLLLITAITFWSSPAMSEDDMMGQMGTTTTNSTPAQNQASGAHQKSTVGGKTNSSDKQMGGMGDMHGMMGQMNSGGNQMGGMSQMGSGNQPNATTDQQANPSNMSEHAKHHPSGGGMGEMMAPMPTPSQSTSVLSVPQGSLEDQMKIQELANKRMEDGTALMTQGIVSLSSAKQKNDVRSMDQATKQIRDGLSQFESGLSAQRALSEGVAPREIGLRWFKQQMNLSSTPATGHGGDILGVSWFHFFVMTALIVFALVMIWMYFFKMRRAAEVLGRVSQPETPRDFR